MDYFEPYSDLKIIELAGIWIHNRLSSVRIRMGPIHLAYQYDIFNSVIRMIATEAGQVIPGNLRWYDSKYVVFRCLYGFLRLHGVLNWDWEMPNAYVDFDMMLYQEIVFPHLNYLRVKYPEHPQHSLQVQNMLSNTYMIITPTFHPAVPTPVYPSADTTAWVDSLLNEIPSFNSDILPNTNDQEEANVL